MNGSASLSGTFAAVVTLVTIHGGLTALACRYHCVGNVVKGHSHLLNSDRQVLWDNLRRSHISERYLIEELRLNANVEDPARVQVACKERSGEAGVVIRPRQTRVIETAVHDGMQIVRLELSGGP